MLIKNNVISILNKENENENYLLLLVFEKRRKIIIQ